MPTHPPTIQNAEHEYNRRLELLRASEVKFKGRDTLLGYAKLFLLLSGVAMAFWLLTARNFSIFWILLPAVLFILLAVMHENVIHALKKCERAILFYEHWPESAISGWEKERRAHGSPIPLLTT